MAITQLGETLTVGFDVDSVYTGVFMEAATKERIAAQKAIKGEDNQTLTVLLSGLGTRRTLRGIVKAAGWSEPRVGDVVTVNSVKYRVESCATEYQAEEARVTLVIIKEDSITYTT